MGREQGVEGWECMSGEGVERWEWGGVEGE